MVKFLKSRADTSGPSSAIGIMRFFDADSKSPKLSPYLVIAIVVIIILIILGMRIMGAQ